MFALRRYQHFRFQDGLPLITLSILLISESKIMFKQVQVYSITFDVVCLVHSSDDTAIWLIYCHL